MTTEPVQPQKKKSSALKVVLIVIFAPCAIGLLVTVIGSIASGLADYSFAVTQGGGEKTESAIAEFTITAKKPGKIVVNTREVALTPGNEQKVTVPLQYGKNTVAVELKVGDKSEKKDYIFYRLSPLEIQQALDKKAAEECKSSPEKYIKVVQHNWQKGGFGTVAEHTVLVQNNCPLPVKDIEFRAVYSAPSGSRVDSLERTVFDVVPAKGSAWMKFSGFAHSQASSASVDVVNAKLAL